MSKEYTDNGIEFDSDLAGPRGMSFTLKPIKGVHTEDDVKSAKRQLFIDRDVVGAFKVEWQTPQESGEFHKSTRIIPIEELPETSENTVTWGFSQPLIHAEEMEDDEYRVNQERIEELEDEIQTNEAEIRRLEIELQEEIEALAEMRRKLEE